MGDLNDPSKQMSEARAHALTASQLLANADSFGDAMKDIDPMKHLELVATGAITRLNKDLEWTIQVAIANALAAIALALTDEGDESA